MLRWDVSSTNVAKYSTKVFFLRLLASCLSRFAFLPRRGYFRRLKYKDDLNISYCHFFKHLKSIIYKTNGLF